MRPLKRIIDQQIIKHMFHKRGGIIKKPLSLMGYKCFNIGKGVRIKAFATIECFKSFGQSEYNPEILLEDNVVIGPFLTILVTDKLRIGANTIIAHNTTIVTENHGVNPESDEPYMSQDLMSASVSIGKNCWIGSNCVILPGAVIGDNCVVAANAVVNKVFPDNVMIAGIPAKIIKVFDFEKHEWTRP